jgi:signal transduction histidine kinase
MSEQPNTPGSDEVAAARQEAADYVVERVESWHEGAEPETVRENLADGMSQAQVPVQADELDRMARDIHDGGSTEAPDVE